MAGYGKKAQAMVKEAMENLKDGASKRGKNSKEQKTGPSHRGKRRPRHPGRPKTSTPSHRINGSKGTGSHTQRYGLRDGAC